MFAFLDICCVVCKKAHWFCIFIGIGLWLLSFVLFLTLLINLIQVAVIKSEYEEVEACLVVDQTYKRETCSGSGCHYLYMPVLVVTFSIDCTSGPNCTDGKELITANAYEEPDPEWYTNPDTMQQYFRHYPIGTEHVCYYEKKQVDKAVMTNNARFLGLSTVLRFIFMIVFIVVGAGLGFFGYRRYLKKKAKAEMKELKKSGKIGKAQAKYGTFQKKQKSAKSGKKKLGKVGKVKKLGKMVMEVA